MSSAASDPVRPSELGLIGEVDGLDDAPGLPIAVLRGGGDGRPPLLAGFGILALVIAVTAALYTSIFYNGEPGIGRRPPPERHPFEVPVDAGPANIIMEVRGDPIMIVRREGARPRPVALGLPASLAGGPSDIPTALRVVDTLVSEDGGFMGSLPDDGSSAGPYLLDSDSGPQLTAEDIVAVMNPAAGDGEMSVADYSLLEADLPPKPVETVSERDIAALVRATAIARGWIKADRRGGRGTEATAAIIREIGSNTSDMAIEPDMARPTIEKTTLTSIADEPIASLMTRNGFEQGVSDAVEQAFADFHGVSTLGVGERLFLRSRRPEGGQPDPVQIAIGSAQDFVGAVARGEDGAYAPAEEPYGADTTTAASSFQLPPSGGYSLRDGIYSAGVRNAIPEPIVREAIAVIGRGFDLSQPAKPGDRVEFLYSPVPRDPKSETGRVIYVGLTAGSTSRPCYVFRTEPNEPFGCLDASGSAATSAGLIPPVKGGRLTSRFGMRLHPILKYTRLHKGIDWGAPLGTPVVAVAPGTVAFAGVASGYGNYVKIAHDAHNVTAYAHLDHIEDGVVAGQKIAQGQRVGYLGNSGLSTGPHLHFELYLDGQPVDPLTHNFNVAEASVPDPAKIAAFADRKSLVDKSLVHVLP